MNETVRESVARWLYYNFYHHYASDEPLAWALESDGFKEQWFTKADSLLALPIRTVRGTCPECKGKGWIINDTSGDGVTVRRSHLCYRCNGEAVFTRTITLADLLKGWTKEEGKNG